MADTYNGTVQVTTTWQDLIVAYPAMANASAWVQNHSNTFIQLAFSSSGSAPAGGGLILDGGEIAHGTAAHCWVRTRRGTANVALGLNDA